MNRGVPWESSLSYVPQPFELTNHHCCLFVLKLKPEVLIGNTVNVKYLLYLGEDRCLCKKAYGINLVDNLQ